MEQFKEEARALARFNDHPGIVKVLNFFNDAGTGTAYIVMAYLDGMTLKDYLRSQGEKIPFETARNILMPVMDTLREVHSVEMLHRDISPDNIFITRASQVKLIDFGAARYAIGERSKTLSVMLKQGYAPFEQYISKGVQGPATDLYALAATFYRAITGQTPSYSTDRQAHDDLKPPSQLGIHIPADAEAALMKALAVRYEDRFQDVASFQSVIAPVMERAGGGEGQGRGRAGANSGQVGLKKWRLATAALAVAALILAIGWPVDSSNLHGRLSSLGSQQAKVQNDFDALLNLTKNMNAYPQRQATITEIRVRNKTDAVRQPIFGSYSYPWTGTYAYSFSSGEVRHLWCSARILNNWAGYRPLHGVLTIKCFYPGESKPRSSATTKDVSTDDSISLDEVKVLDWLEYTGTSAPTGTYHIKFLWDGTEIADLPFVVTLL